MSSLYKLEGQSIQQMAVKWILSDYHACGHIRGEIIAREINKQYPNVRMDCKAECMISDFYKTSMMVFQRASTEVALSKVHLAKRLGIKTVYDIDDDFIHTPPEFQKPYVYYNKPEVKKLIIDIANACDAVICSTEPLLESFAKNLNPKHMVVVKNSIDVERWNEAFATRCTMPQTDNVTIGWMASGSHQIDAPLVEEAIRQLLDEYPNLRLHFIGWIGFEQFKGWDIEKYKDRVKIEPWLDINILPHAMMDFDISLAPLADNQYNRCKSAIKVLQAGSLGIPTVASPICVYDGFAEGSEIVYAAHNSPKGWYESLKKLVTDRELRKNIGMTARKMVTTKYDTRDRVEDWVIAFNRIMRM